MSNEEHAIPQFRKAGASGLVLCLALFLLCSHAALAQTLNITGGIQVHASLSGTTVNMSGRSELHITATSNPIPGCTINLNSADAWFFMDNIQPATVVSTYLGQVRVSGANAVLDSNVRVVEYGMGSVVIPHAPGLQPLQAFTGNQFTGTTANYGLYTYHTNLGSMNNAISSFILKRGYLATFAQQADGNGMSRVYVAQDADIEVGVLSSDLNDQIESIRVVPWRWTAKKGWAGGAELLVNPLWNYDWDNFISSSLNIEYVPMRHNANWNAYANINGKQNSTHALGFNEPDRPDQANMTVAAALAQWPNLQRSGLRLGAPAVSDSGTAGMGTDWLYSFMDQADAQGLRVDFVPVHFYKCGWTATQYYNWLRAIHIRTGRPVWITEFNNGANWCAGTPPTFAENATRINEFLNMLEGAPFVERYSIYNWVGDTRAMVTNGALTPAGVIYRDKVSARSYLQELPNAAGLDAKYTFNTDGRDSTNGSHAMLIGAPTFAAGQVGQAVQLDGVRSFVQVPANLGDSANFTFAGWVNWNGGANWQRIFDFGTGTDRYMLLTPSSGSGTLRFAITTNGNTAEQRIERAAPLPSGVWTHVAVTINGAVGKIYINGAPVATNSSMTVRPSNVLTKYNYLGKSQFPDPLFAGRLDEVVINGYALTDAQVAALVGGGGSLPEAPTGLTATGSNSTVRLTWVQSTSPGITQNKVYRSTTGSGGPFNLLATLSPSLAHSDNTAVNGNTYFYVVTAVNGNGESAFSAYRGGTPLATPGGLAAQVLSSTSVRLTWNSAAGASTYNVKRATVSGGPYTTVASGVTTLSFTNTALVNGTTYYYVVSSANVIGESSNSSQVSVTPTGLLLSQGRPATASSFQPGNLVANGNDGSGTTRWTASSSAMPAWWRVDLGSSQPITRAVIDWYNNTPRAYQYRIETSNNDSTWTTLVDKTGNTVQGTTTDTFSATARYVRITVTGVNPAGGWAAFWECRIYGN